MEQAREPGRMLLLDTASLYFRAYYGVPDTVKAPDGTPVNAVRGLLDMIAKLATTYRPSRVIGCWDDDWRPQWRVDLIPSYKAHRVARSFPDRPDTEEVPEALEAQLPAIRAALTALGIPIVGRAHYEADDIIGSLATQAAGPVDVVTGDRDLLQLVDDRTDVRLIYTGRGMSNLELVTDAVVVGRYGVLPEQYADFATLRGDASDGLPGVVGIGDKTAAALLAAHGDLPGIVAAAESGHGMSAGVRSKILAARDYLAVAPEVVRVVRDLDLESQIALHANTPLGPDPAAARGLADRWALGGSMDRALAALAP